MLLPLRYLKAGRIPPASVPTPKTDKLCPAFWMFFATFKVASSSLTPSAISNICPFSMPACVSNSCAFCKPKSARLPCEGIMLGVSTCSNPRMVSVSRVKGDAVKASPANNTKPICPSSFFAKFSDKISSTLKRARARREGFKSAINIELDKSNTITRAELV